MLVMMTVTATGEQGGGGNVGYLNLGGTEKEIYFVFVLGGGLGVVLG